MPINTNLNTAPYFDDYNIENQYYKVLFKPGFAVQAREMTQLQTMLQSQVEQFGDNIFKEGSIVKGCNFTNLNELSYVTLTDAEGFDPLSYISRRVTENLNGLDVELDYVYQVTNNNGITASIVSATRGFETRPPDLNTFFIHYLTSNESNALNAAKEFQPGEELQINLLKYKVDATDAATDLLILDQPNVAENINVRVSASNPTGLSYGIQSAPGVIFQKGHFLFVAEQTLIVSKYNNIPNGVAVGYRVKETLISALQDSALYDNANSSNNENAPGADRLELIPTLTVFTTEIADADPTFFSLIRYQNGNEVTLRDVSQFNVLGEEMARRTYEESGNYILNDFKVKTDRRNGNVETLVGTGTAYVKGFRVENSAERSFIIDPIAATESQINQPISFNYGSYVDIITFTGRVLLNDEVLVLRDSGGSAIGTALASNLTGNVGTNQGRLYLYGIRMDNNERFSDVYNVDCVNGTLQISNGSTTAVLKETSKGPLIFDTGMFSLKELTNTTLPIRRATAATQSGGIITIAPFVDEDFACNNTDIVVIDDTQTFQQVQSQTNGSGSLVITLASGSGSANVTVYHNSRINNQVTPSTKSARNTHVKVNFVTSAQKETLKFSLGFPDVFAITSIQDIEGVDFTSSFRLRTNQKDRYYDLSYMEYIQGRPLPTSNGELIINIQVFELSSVDEYFFAVNSYPATQTEIGAANIPVYKSDSGQKYNLRECLDFRPYVDKLPGVSYNNSDPANATLITQDVNSTTPTFADNPTSITPALDQFATADIEYYLTRIDLIVANSYGEIQLIKGTEERFAVPPKIDSQSITISEVKVPGFPALTSQEATEQERREYAVKARPVGTKNFTMKDLDGLEKKIDRLAYYVSLSQLESETANFSVLDENGLSRFKNGFLADPFNDLSLANVSNVRFNAAVAFNEKKLTPSVQTFPIDLVYAAGVGTNIFPSSSVSNVATLGRDSDVSIISQPFASEFRNCVSNFYKYNGEGTVSPPYDAAYDTTTNPLTLDIDLTSTFDDFVDNIQQFVPLTDVSRSTTTAMETWEPEMFRGRARPITLGGWQQTQQETTTTRNLTVTPTTTENMVGEFVTDFRFNAYMAARDIKIHMTGLRPLTQHFFFFDGTNVNADVYPGTPANDANLVERFGLKGAIVISDSVGTLRAVFNIPAGKFFVGDRIFDVVDVDQYASIESGSTSRGFVTYRAYNFSVERAALTTSTRAPDFDIASTTTTRNLPRRATGGRDPLAQTFFIKQGMGSGSKTVFLSKVDLYFKRKADSGNGVTVMIREVTNGYPSNQIVPFSKVHYIPSQVNVSDDASIPTEFTFPAPIRLDVEKEYAVVVQPDASDPNYLIFTSKVGGVDLSPGITNNQSIVQDWGDGVLFTSTNNKAWKSYQDEDIKFTLYRHNFSTSSGTVTLKPNNPEFLTVDDITGRFNVDELIYQIKGSTTTLSMSEGSQTGTGSGLSKYATGDYVLLVNTNNISTATRKDIFRVVSVQGTTGITFNKPTSFNVQSETPIVAGNLSFYDVNNPAEMYLEKSSAKTNRTFESGTVVLGLDSGFQANLSSLDNIEISYIQPMIMKANDSVSTTSMSGTFVSPNNTSVTYDKPMKFGNNNYFSEKGAVLFSRSNEPTKPFNININMDNGTNSTSTPFIDIEASKLIAYRYKISNDSVTSARFISKTIELAEDLDAEDMNVIVTGYRPQGTDIKVWIKAQNVYDSVNFDTVEWIELELFEGVGAFSSTVNVNDYREFQYKVSEANKDGNGVLQYQNAGQGIFEGFRRFSVRIDMISENLHNVPTLKDYRAIALT